MNLRSAGCATWGIPIAIAIWAFLSLGNKEDRVSSAAYTLLVPLLLLWIFFIALFLAKRWNIRGWRIRGFLWITGFIMIVISLDGSVSWMNRLYHQWLRSYDSRYELVLQNWINLQKFRLPPTSGFTVAGPFLPNRTGSSIESDIKIDRFGFRREVMQIAETDLEETLNILFLGGSVVFGMTTHKGDIAIPDFVQMQLAERLPDHPVRTLNAGFPGQTIRAAFRDLRDHFINLPIRGVVFYEGINLLAPGQRGFLRERASAIRSWHFNSQIRNRARDAVNTYTGSLYRTSLEAMIRLCDEQDLFLILATFAIPYSTEDPPHELQYWDRIQNGQATGYASARIVETHNRIMREMAGEHRIPLVDLAAEFTGKQELFLDTCHPTQEGMKRMAQRITEVILSDEEFILSLEPH